MKCDIYKILNYNQQYNFIYVKYSIKIDVDSFIYIYYLVFFFLSFLYTAIKPFHYIIFFFN